MIDNSTAKNGIHDDILTWSKELPLWQRDALRRIVENGKLSDDDLDELTNACRDAHRLVNEETTELQPITADHLPGGHRGNSRVTLRSISEAKYVNAIDHKQTLPFADTGLTIVFGYNGSGKSGYGRVLRRACRARSKGDAILPNVLKESSDGPARAKITFSVDGIEQPPETWVDGQASADPLTYISFFDSACASAHVRGRNDIAFTPHGLDVLPSLGSGCKGIQSRLESEKKILEAETPKFLDSEISRGSTKVGLTLRGLEANTAVEDLDALASLTDAERRRMDNLSAQLASDPKKLAKELRTRAGRIKTLGSTLKAAESALSEEAISSIKGLSSDLETKAKAARIAAKENFADDPLTHIGEPVWRQLWEAARKYSVEALPDKQFPATEGDNAICVLCQQPIGADAKDRMARFEQYVRNDSAQQASSAKERLDECVTSIKELGLRDKGLREQLKDVESTDSMVNASVRQTLATLLRRMRVIKQAHESGKWKLQVPGSLDQVSEKLSELEAKIRSQADAVERTADTEERQRLEAELDDLKAREWFETIVDDVKHHVQRLSQVARLKKAINETRTNRITSKSKELAKTYVTDQLRGAFANEIKKMQQGVRRLNVELVATAGEYGSAYYRVQLVGASKADIGAVVSEGEHRCIALAGFLSELATEPCKSTVVFDDPVTSLDHHWRGCFAQRLVEEAADRQVIVFTHDIAFLHELYSGAKRYGTPIELQRVKSDRDYCGVVDDGLPWIAQKTLPRIDELEKRTRASRSDFDTHNDDEYEREICAIYGELRATVERTVEEKLFAGIVTRHQEYISLKDLKKVTVITTDHCDRLQMLFQRCCDITSAHDRSSLRGFGVPTPDDALDDLRELRSIVDDLKDKQKAIS